MNLSKSVIQLAKYFVVGLLASFVEWFCFYCFIKIGVHYLPATCFAFIFSTFANWYFGKKLLFKKKTRILDDLWKIYLTSTIGLILNLILMWLFVEITSIPPMPAKITTTALVFFWNFFIRKLVIYKI